MTWTAAGGRATTWVILGFAIGYFFYNLTVAWQVSGHPIDLGLGQSLAINFSDGTFLVYVVFSCWLIAAVLDAERVAHSTMLPRYGSRMRALRRAGFQGGVVHSVLIVSILAITWSLLTLGVATAGHPREQLLEDWAHGGLSVAMILVVQMAKLAVFLTVFRALVFAVRFSTPSPVYVRTGAILLWVYAGVSLFLAPETGRTLSPIHLMNALSGFSDTALQLRTWTVLLVIGAFSVGMTALADARTGGARLRRIILDAPKVWLGGAVAALGAILVAVTASRNGSDLSVTVGELFAGYGGTLTQALIEAVLTIGYAWWVFQRAEARREQGWSELELLRAGSWRRWLARFAGDEVRRLAIFMVAVFGIVFLGHLVANGEISGGEWSLANWAFVGYQLVVNGYTQIAIYVAVVVLVGVIARTRVLTLIVIGVMVMVPFPGVVSPFLPAHRAGLGPVLDYGWEWALTITVVNLATLALLVTVSAVVAHVLSPKPLSKKVVRS